MSKICRRCGSEIDKDTEGFATSSGLEGDTTQYEHMECPGENPWERDIKNIVAFCILMESGSGILSKHPSYIWEKFRRYVIEGVEEGWKWGLDANNESKMKRWIEIWEKKENEND